MLIDEVRKVFLSQPACLELGVPIKICGDTHGQYTDLIRLFAQCGFPSTTNYLFLGDYVDRGKQNLELIMLMFGYKVSMERKDQENQLEMAFGGLWEAANPSNPSRTLFEALRPLKVQ